MVKKNNSLKNKVYIGFILSYGHYFFKSAVSHVLPTFILSEEHCTVINLNVHYIQTSAITMHANLIKPCLIIYSTIT